MYELMSDFISKSISDGHSILSLFSIIPELIFAALLIMCVLHYRKAARSSNNTHDTTLKKMSILFMLSSLIIIVCKLYPLNVLSRLIATLIIAFVSFLEPPALIGGLPPLYRTSASYNLSVFLKSKEYVDTFEYLCLYITVSAFEIFAVIFFLLHSRKSTKPKSKILLRTALLISFIVFVTIACCGWKIKYDIDNEYPKWKTEKKAEDDAITKDYEEQKDKDFSVF